MDKLNFENKENLFLQALSEIKLSDRKLILWGAGSIAAATYNFLYRNGINVDAVAVNRKYFDINNAFCKWGGGDIVILEDYISEHPGCDVLVSFNGYRDEFASKIKQNIHKIYCFDVIGILVLGSFWMIDYKYLDKHKKDLFWLRDELVDNKSKTAFDDYLHQKMTGNYEKKYTDNQYFDNEIINFCEDEVFVDCGVYTGDTIEKFIFELKKQKINNYKRIYGIEADETNYEKAKTQLKEYSNIELINKGAWNYSGVYRFTQDKMDAASSIIDDDGEIEIEVQTIDSIVRNEKVTFIKMDIEGAELNALQGSVNTIVNNRPKLAICLYHRPEDLYEIPKFIKKLVPEYNFYFRNHSPYGIESVLYAVYDK